MPGQSQTRRSFLRQTLLTAFGTPLALAVPGALSGAETSFVAQDGSRTSTRVAIVATLLASASGAWADGKYKRQQDVKINVKLSDKVKPIQPKTQNASEMKPELTADAVLSIEGLVSNIRNEQEQILQQLIDQTPDSEVEEKSSEPSTITPDPEPPAAPSRPWWGWPSAARHCITKRCAAWWATGI